MPASVSAAPAPAPAASDEKKGGAASVGAGAPVAESKSAAALAATAASDAKERRAKLMRRQSAADLPRSAVGVRDLARPLPLLFAAAVVVSLLLALQVGRDSISPWQATLTLAIGSYIYMQREALTPASIIRTILSTCIAVHNTRACHSTAKHTQHCTPDIAHPIVVCLSRC
jgi:hypothetical protein